MSLHRDTYAVINLKYLKENIEQTYKKFKRPLMAVIKADAYGHGYKEVASYIKDIDYFRRNFYSLCYSRWGNRGF